MLQDSFFGSQREARTECGRYSPQHRVITGHGTMNDSVLSRHGKEQTSKLYFDYNSLLERSAYQSFVEDKQYENAGEICSMPHFAAMLQKVDNADR